jgi:DNA-binding response OmpR family regulator
MTVQRILVVDDEQSILEVVDFALTQEGYEVHTATDAATAESEFARVSPALVILDIMLPDRSGLEVARSLRAHSGVPIIMLSARADEVDRILGLEFGADDYVTKPFSPRELVTRVKTILRRSGVERDERAMISLGDLQIDVLSREASVSGAPIRLTHTEYEILLHLARHPGTAFSREEILASLHDVAPGGDERAIDVHIHNIREKLEPDPKEPAHILTVRGFGYRLKES